MPTYLLLSFPIVMLSSTECQTKYLRSRKNNRIKREVIMVLAQRYRKPKSITPTHKTKKRIGSGEHTAILIILLDPIRELRSQGN